MISEQEDTAKRRAKQAKGMDFDNWALIYGEDVAYLLGQLGKARKTIIMMQEKAHEWYELDWITERSLDDLCSLGRGE